MEAFSKITDIVAIQYALLLILLVLMYIAFYKDPRQHKHKHSK